MTDRENTTLGHVLTAGYIRNIVRQEKWLWRYFWTKAAQARYDELYQRHLDTTAEKNDHLKFLLKVPESE